MTDGQAIAGITAAVLTAVSIMVLAAGVAANRSATRSLEQKLDGVAMLLRAFTDASKTYDDGTVKLLRDRAEAAEALSREHLAALQTTDRNESEVRWLREHSSELTTKLLATVDGRAAARIEDIHTGQYGQAVKVTRGGRWMPPEEFEPSPPPAGAPLGSAKAE